MDISLPENLTPAQYVGYAIALIALVQLFLVFFVNRRTMMEDLRGKDKTWQFGEISGIMWIILFPTLAICELFGLSAGSVVWYSMDTIYFINILGRSANKFIETKYSAQYPDDKKTKDKSDEN